MPATRLHTVCPHDCPDTCAMLAMVQDGRLVRVAGDPEDPFTRGFLCAKVNRYPERVHSPERLLQPLRRKGPKGSGAWEPVSWDEALDEIVTRWRAIQAEWGSEALVGYAYSGHMGQVSRGLPRALFHALGASQVQLSTVCDTAAEAGWAAAYGDVSPLDPEDAARSDLVVAWGADVATTNVHLLPFIDDARRQGARLVAIAPIPNRTARRADWFLPVRVGTDAALALGVAHVLFRDGLADLDYLRRDATGWEAWAEQVAARYTPEWAAAETGLTAGQVERLARELAAARAPFIRIGPALARHRTGGRAVLAVALLAALLGAWERPGAGAFLETAHAFGLDYDALRRPDLLPRPTRVINHARLGAALTELQDPPVMALLVMANNPAVTCPDAGRVRQGLLREDIFAVVHDTFMTDTAALADLVLPATTAMETEDFFRSYGHLYLRHARPVLSPQGEARSNAWVIQELAARLGLTDPVFTRSVPDHLRAVAGEETAEALLRGRRVKASPTGGPGRWGTPSGRVDFTRAPEYVPDLPPGQVPPYPLRLLSTPDTFQSHTGFEGVETLRRRAGASRVVVNPQEAAGRGLKPGDEVELYNDRGHAGLHLEVSDDVPPGLAVVAGQRSARFFLSGGPLNVLTSSELTDMGEGATYQSTWVEVRRKVW
ncbi:molybdopterin-containing oxidoreductase family protein [Limnochorda pilosa]|uniref:Formate dehydrogenase n=1 Tax=Limnochorda pilosa TaxID=1555112 RepID=A0A0K2SIP3_LIMPI|nr:molybdopterin-dependent oxidoreductase [Limnochorda pilosa]BAS26689.1 formate dehydrogenase [Limnochorda pilosa]